MTKCWFTNATKESTSLISFEIPCRRAKSNEWRGRQLQWNIHEADASFQSNFCLLCANQDNTLEKKLQMIWHWRDNVFQFYAAGWSTDSHISFYKHLHSPQFTFVTQHSMNSFAVNFCFTITSQNTCIIIDIIWKKNVA